MSTPITLAKHRISHHNIDLSSNTLSSPSLIPPAAGLLFESKQSSHPGSGRSSSGMRSTSIQDKREHQATPHLSDSAGQEVASCSSEVVLLDSSLYPASLLVFIGKRLTPSLGFGDALIMGYSRYYDYVHSTLLSGSQFIHLLSPLWFEPTCISSLVTIFLGRHPVLSGNLCCPRGTLRH